MSKVVLSCSLLANVLLVLLIAHDPASPWDGARAQRPDGAAPGVVTVGGPVGVASAPTRAATGADARAVASRSVSSREGASARAYFDRLRALGLDDAEAKTLVLARLEQESRPAPPPDHYWLHGAASRAEHALATFEAAAGVRRRLLATFGEAAARDAAFRALFRPLDPYLPFLSSAEQLALQRVGLEGRAASAAALGRPAAPPAGTAGAAARLAGGQGAAVSAAAPDLGAVLSADSLLEYELRESPLAEHLRSATESLSEEAFRRAFVLLRRMEGGGELDAHLAARTELERILGARAFIRLWSARDPLYRAAAGVAGRYGWSEQTTAEAYTLLLRLDEQLLRAVDAAGGDPAPLANELRQLESDAAARLADLVGEEGAAALLRARAVRSLPAQEAGISPGA